MKQIADAIWTSKVRYCIALYANICVKPTDPKSKAMKDLQIAQNKVLRLLTGHRRTDRKSIKDMLEETGFSSINQMAAETMLFETWKNINIPGAPLKSFLNKMVGNSYGTRATERGDLQEDGASKCLWNQAAKLWNKTSPLIRKAESIPQVKREIKKYVKMLPI